MDLQSMRFFIATADAGSFSSAAEILNYAQSNLSSRIKQLEDELGEQLFYRHRKGVIMTAKGQLFYEYATKMLRLSDEAVTAIRNMDEARGTLRLGSLEAIVMEDLPELLAKYYGKYPDVKLSVTTDMNDQLMDAVLDRSLDGAFIAAPVSHPDLIAIPFNTKHLVIVGSASEASVSADTILAEKPLITFPEGSIFRHRFELLLSSKSTNYLSRLHTMNSFSANVLNICAGIGYGYLPRSGVSSYIEQGLMQEYPLDDPYSELHIAFVYRRDRIMDAAFRFFIADLDS